MASHIFCRARKTVSECLYVSIIWRLAENPKILKGLCNHPSGRFGMQVSLAPVCQVTNECSFDNSRGLHTQSLWYSKRMNAWPAVNRCRLTSQVHRSAERCRPRCSTPYRARMLSVYFSFYTHWIHRKPKCQRNMNSIQGEEDELKRGWFSESDRIEPWVFFLFEWRSV